MTFTHLVITLVIGGVVGWLASIVMKTNAQMGIVANVVIGIAGSFVGGWLARQLGLHTSGEILPFLVSVGGAALLILVLRMVGVFK